MLSGAVRTIVHKESGLRNPVQIGVVTLDKGTLQLFFIIQKE